MENTTEHHHPNTLTTYHTNPRRGDVQAIADSLHTNGQYRPIVINRGTHTGTPNEVLVGNHTLQAIQHLATQHPEDPRWDSVTTYVVDVDTDQAARIVLADNKTSDNANYDDDTLHALLSAVDHDLDGTGYNYDDLDALEAIVNPTEPAEPEDVSSGDARKADDGDGRGEYVEGEGLVRPGGQTRTAGTYHEQPTRMMILSYGVDQHQHVADLFHLYHDAHPNTGRKNHRAIIQMLEHYTDTTAPQEDEAQ